MIVDRAAAEDWIRAHIQTVGAIEIAHERPWSTVLRVPISDSVAWFKACAPIQAFEPALTAALYARWPDRVPEVLAHDVDRAWMLLADAGTPLSESGNPPDAWLVALPLYTELQRGEIAHAAEHLASGVPDLRLPALPARYEELMAQDLPLAEGEIDRLKGLAPRFAALCDQLAAYGLPDTIQHDDLHMKNVYAHGNRLRLLDWGDSSVSQPFASLVVTFRFLEEVTGLPPDDPWFARLRDAYMEPWGRELATAFPLALRVGTVAHTFGWARQRGALSGKEHVDFDRGFSIVLRRALGQLSD